ncbi:MAG: hypothetical protein NC548_31250 [Lachnospiraceae bacterium]|nr:hypothetical protein [Lachnospiraceae bacterium]
MKVFNRPLKKAEKMTLCSSDYMRPYTYYEVSEETRLKIIEVLKQERENIQKEFENLS